MPEILSANACRVLGCLMEKEVTVPASYPLTVNSVITVANQSTGRDPLMHLDPHAVEAALDELREGGLVRRVHASHGARVVKYRHVADEQLGLDEPGLAVVALLLLRGPQTPGELRTRSDRLHPFASVDEVAATLDELAARDEPLVIELTRRPGQKEQRWAHLLAGPVSDAADDRTGAGRARQPTEPKPLEIGPEVALLAPFAGHWVGAGAGSYPTIGVFTYTQEIDLLPIPGKPFLSYRSATRHATEHRPLHAESGFLRLVDDEGSVELVIAQGSGLVEIAEGIVDGRDLLLTSTLIGRSGTAKDVTATERRYRVDDDGGSLGYELAMEAVGEPMTHHLQARLTRQ